MLHTITFFSLYIFLMLSVVLRSTSKYQELCQGQEMLMLYSLMETSCHLSISNHVGTLRAPWWVSPYPLIVHHLEIF
ncbi:hypothetical protein KP509_02G038600 [Ceratopteris richardii]|uniref:Uncharacterized protein n=1 Tax=Ceratopteris richardii TaxID=49495 RepID=A0A8T2V8H9_CERRI|nr:hypothetical protein KP509_02G038600 [Ceratopteris richardii]